ncbi:ribosome maturation factor RimM [Bacteroidia bacterium]|nr:ribosome maturation factor RimM [Bacteroidia bacterium]
MKIGRVQKNFGVHGELLVAWYGDELPAVDAPLFASIEGLWVPFFVQSVESKNAQKVVIVFEDMDTEALAKELVGKELYTNSSTAADDAGTHPMDEWIGYSLYDKDAQLGKITQWFDFRGNVCFEVLLPSQAKVLVPAHPDLMERVDKKNSCVYMQLPEGLL